MTKTNKKIEKTIVWVGIIIIIAFIVASILGIGALITMWIWNLLMPYLFHLPQINVWMAFAINLVLGAITPTIKIIKK